MNMKKIALFSMHTAVALLLAGAACSSKTPDEPSRGDDNNSSNTTVTVTGNTDIKVMTFNMRYDNSGDGDNIWANRRDRVAECVKFYSPDILGAQELLDNQYTDLKNRLTDYASLGTARDDGKTEGEYGPLFYKKDRFTKTRDGQFWLSATPDKVSLGWDGGCKRIATWAILTDRYTGKQVFAMNTHLDNSGAQARSEGVKLLLEKAKSLASNMPIIITGDFNATPGSSVHNDMKAGGMRDSRELSPVKYGPEWTWHDWKGHNYEWRGILDYVFTKGNIDIKSYGALAETNEGRYLSDHLPVLVTLSLK